MLYWHAYLGPCFRNLPHGVLLETGKPWKASKILKGGQRAEHGFTANSKPGYTTVFWNSKDFHACFGTVSGIRKTLRDKGPSRQDTPFRGCLEGRPGVVILVQPNPEPCIYIYIYMPVYST